ncbi:Odorant receptor, partial [Temnothorax longispinosus]
QCKYIIIDELLLLRSVCWQLLKQMEHSEEHYYKLNRFLLSLIGLSPYQSKRRARLIRAVLTINSILITSDVTMDYMVDWMSAVLIVSGSLSNLYTRIIHVDKPSKQMEHPEEHYYKLNRFLLSVTGLSPYQSKRRAHLIRAVLTVTLLISICFLINSIFITSDITMDYMVDWIPTFLIVTGGLTNLYMRVTHVDK